MYYFQYFVRSMLLFFLRQTKVASLSVLYSQFINTSAMTCMIQRVMVRVMEKKCIFWQLLINVFLVTFNCWNCYFLSVAGSQFRVCILPSAQLKGG